MHYSSHAFQAWQKPSASGPCSAGCHARPLRRSMLRQTGLPRAAFTASEKIRRARPALQKNMMRRGKRRSATSRSGKKPGRRIIRRDSRKFALLPHEASEPRKSAVVAPLAEPGPFACRAHAESLRRQSPRRANPPVASAESRSRRKLARRAPWRDPGPQRARTAPSCGKAAPHDSAVRRARLAASAQKPQARSADAHPAPQPRCSSAP